MTKNQFGAMMKALQQEGKFKFPSEEKLQAPSSCDHMHMMHTSHAHSSGKCDMHACTLKHALGCAESFTRRAHIITESLLTLYCKHAHAHADMCMCMCI